MEHLEHIIKVNNSDIGVFVHIKLDTLLHSLGWKQNDLLSDLTTDMTDMLGVPVIIYSDSIFIELLLECIKEIGEELFKGFGEKEKVIFDLLDKSPFLFGYSDSYFYFNKYIFDEILPSLHLIKLQRTTMKMFITHVLLEALKKEEKGQLSQNDFEYFINHSGSKENLDILLSVLRSSKGIK